MKRRDELWPTVNVALGVVTEANWNGVAAGAVGTLRRIGSRYATIEFADQRLPAFAQVPIAIVRPADELAARRHRERHGYIQ